MPADLGGSCGRLIHRRRAGAGRAAEQVPLRYPPTNVQPEEDEDEAEEEEEDAKESDGVAPPAAGTLTSRIEPAASARFATPRCH